MPRREVTIEQFPEILREMPGKFHEAAVRGLRSAARQLEGYVVQEIIKADAVATGGLAGSAKTENLHDGARVVVDAPHAAAVEHGTRPHFPPIQPLADWVKTKGLASGPQEARSIAYAIALTISRRGTFPRHYMRKAWSRIKPKIDGHIMREWNRMRP